jgi:DNA relaxase NicK
MFTGRQFAHRAKSACGASAIWNLPGQNSDKGSMRIALSGEILKRAQQMQSVRFMAYCSRLGAICNRLDLKADDYSRSMHPDLLQAACDAGNVKGFRKSTIHRDMYQFDVFESGWTLYFGSRTSDRFTRYYNAKPLHEIEAWRFECEFKHSIANEIMNHLILCIDDEELLIRMIASNIAGNISFIDRSDEPRANRCYELSWWERFTDRLGSSIRLSLPKIVPTIQKSINWIENKVSASLAMVAQYYGTDKIEYIKKLIQRGEHKLTNRHQAILDTSPIAMRILL